MALLETLQDDWSSGSVDSGRWPDVSNATYVTVVSGALNVTSPAATTQYNYAQSGLTWDLTGSYIYGRVTTATVSGGGTGSQETYLMVSKDVNNQLYVYRGGNVLYRGIKTAGVVTETVMNATYNATNHAWWRIRHNAGTGLVHYAYSADAVNWTESGGQSVSWAITGIRATLMVGKFTAADPAGTGTFDNINTNGYPSPTGIALAVALDDPSADANASVPALTDGIVIPIALDAPSSTVDASPATPTEISVPVTLDPPTADFVSDATALTDGIALAIALDPPQADAILGVSDLADGIVIPLALDAPSSTVDANPVTMLSIAVPIALDAPTADFAPSAPADGVAVPIALDAPTAAVDAGPATPTEISVPIALDDPSALYTAPAAALTDGVVLPVALDAPTAAFDAATAPTEITVPVALDPPTSLYTAPATDLTDGVVLPIALDAPSAAFDATATPNGIPLAIGLDAPDAATAAFDALLTDGLALPIALDPPDALVLSYIETTVASLNVAIGLGAPQADRTSDARQFVPPIVPDLPFLRRPVPFHLMAIGAANSGIEWRGAPNYGIVANTSIPSRPTLQLPEAQSKSFTLRLNAPSEARADHQVERQDAIVIQELVTDLWWRRRDPVRNVVEVIGRFNADNVDLSSSATGVQLSATWVDYRGLLEDRLVLKYLDVVNSESMWAAGTQVTEILRFAIPDNAGIDLANIAVGTAFALGVTKQPFELPPGTPISEVMTNLLAISPQPWEWWVDMPDNDGERPKLMFALNERGSDNGVTLFDIGSGSSPIENWTMQTAGDAYANAIYYVGGTGGVVFQIDADIARYGQRDATDSDSSLAGNVTLIEAAAQKRLLKLADRTPTWTLTLRTGFWEGRSHIDLGDWVSVHIRLGNELLSGKHRVTEIQADIDSSGLERVNLVLGTPRPAKDPRSRNSAVARLVRRLKNYERKGTT